MQRVRHELRVEHAPVRLPSDCTVRLVATRRVATAEAATAVCVLPSKARAENGVAAPPNRIFNAAHRQSQVRHERRVVARALHPRYAVSYSMGWFRLSVLSAYDTTF